MDMYELSHPRRGAAAAVPDDASEAAHWSAVVARIGGEIAGPLSNALERVIELASTGRIDRVGLRALRNEVEQARNAGIATQQLARFAAGGVRQSHERLHLTQTLRGVLTQRSREVLARGIQVKQLMQPVEVLVDPALLDCLLNTLLDWSLECAQSHVEFRLDVRSWPQHGRLSCRFAFRPLDMADAPAPDAEEGMVDTLSWHLLEQTARTMGLHVSRQLDAAQVTLTLEFPRTVGAELPGMSAVELDTGFSSTLSSRPLAGSHVLVVASRRDVRNQIRESIRNLGLLIDFVNSVDEAVAFCDEGLPHCLVIEGVLRGEKFDRLAEKIREQAPELVFIEIVEEGRSFEISGFSGCGMARVGRDALMSALPSALVFELSKGQ